MTISFWRIILYSFNTTKLYKIACMLPKKKPKLLNATLASESLQKLSLKSKNGKTKISEIMEDFHENGILLAMVFVWMRGLEGYKWLL